MVIPDCECNECVEANEFPESVEMRSQPENVEMPSEDEDAVEPTDAHTAYKSKLCRQNYTEAEIIHSFLQIVYQRSIQVLKLFSY